MTITTNQTDKDESFYEKNCLGERPRVLRLRFRRRPRRPSARSSSIPRWSGIRRSSPIPSYTDQMVVMTYPLIGNYGMTDEDYETSTPTIGGMIVREYNDSPSQLPLYQDAGRGVRGARHSRHLGRGHPRADAHYPRRGAARRCSSPTSATPRDEALRRLGGIRRAAATWFRV